MKKDNNISRIKGLIVCALLIILPQTVNAGIEDAYNRTTDVKKIGWMDKGIKMVRTKLKDGDSAKFKNVYFHKGAKGIPMTCGNVNSKNSFGGYSGYQRFISAGRPELTYLEEQVSDFDRIWNLFCR